MIIQNELTLESLLYELERELVHIEIMSSSMSDYVEQSEFIGEVILNATNEIKSLLIEVRKVLDFDKEGKILEC